MAQYDEIDHNPLTAQLAYGGGKLYQRHSNGQIWKFNGPHASPRWSLLAGNDSLLAIAASPKHLYKLRTNGQVLRYNEGTARFDVIKTLSNVKDAIASENAFYYIMAGNTVSGIATNALDDPSTPYEELEKQYTASKVREAQDQAEIARLQNIKAADDKVIKQLQADYEGAQAQNATLTAQLKEAREQAAQTEKTHRDQISQLQRALANAEAAEKKLADDLDEEKKKAHEQWKKDQEHDAEDHKALNEAHQALEKSQAENTELKKTVDQLTMEVTAKTKEIAQLESVLADTKKKLELAEAELKKHLTDDISDDMIIEGLEKVIQGLKKEIEGQEELMAVLRKQVAKQ